MRTVLGFTAILAGVLLASTAARADDGAPWRVTSPRVRLTHADGRLELVIPAGRARGATSRAIPIEPGQTYLAMARLDLDDLIAKGAFLRVALYARTDGRGRQRLRLDSTALRAGADGVSVGFLTPAWARAAKLRVLARPSADGTALDASDVLLLPLESAPDVILRPDE